MESSPRSLQLTIGAVGREIVAADLEFVGRVLVTERPIKEFSSLRDGVGVLAALEGTALIVWHLVATPFIGRRRLRWGTVGTETAEPLAGDEFVPEPKWWYTLGIAVDASPEDVWPWIAQIGQGRGGLYTYQTLENLAGCRITNTTEILPDHQLNLYRFAGNCFV